MQETYSLITDDPVLIMSIITTVTGEAECVESLVLACNFVKPGGKLTLPSKSIYWVHLSYSYKDQTFPGLVPYVIYQFTLYQVYSSPSMYSLSSLTLRLCSVLFRLLYGNSQVSSQSLLNTHCKTKV